MSPARTSALKAVGSGDCPTTITPSDRLMSRIAARIRSSKSTTKIPSTSIRLLGSMKSASCSIMSCRFLVGTLIEIALESRNICSRSASSGGCMYKEAIRLGSDRIGCPSTETIVSLTLRKHHANSLGSLNYMGIRDDEAVRINNNSRTNRMLPDNQGDSVIVFHRPKPAGLDLDDSRRDLCDHIFERATDLTQQPGTGHCPSCIPAPRLLLRRVALLAEQRNGLKRSTKDRDQQDTL